MRRKGSAIERVVFIMIKRMVSLTMAVIMIVVFCVSCAAGNDKDIVINEIVSKNKTLIDDEDGDSSDYVELYNSGTGDINLKGWFLSDKEDDARKWTFPDITVKAGEYLIVFCSGKNKFNQETGEVHTNFKLSSKGEVVSLISAEGVVISFVEFGKSVADAAYGLKEPGVSEYVWFERGTPGAQNRGNIYESIKDHPAYKNEDND